MFSINNGHCGSYCKRAELHFELALRRRCMLASVSRGTESRCPNESYSANGADAYWRRSPIRCNSHQKFGGAMPVRRLVTGHSDNQKAVFVSDEEVTPRVWPDSNFEFLRLWGGDTRPAFPDAGVEPTYQTYFPPDSGFRFGIFTIAAARSTPPKPEEVRASYSEAERLFPGLMSHLEQDSPGMHTSDSIDFGYIISGRIWLELDDGTARELRAGDTYVQNGTRHAWRNRSLEPCSILVVLLGASRDPSGLSLAQSRG
ncbi:MAG: cupin domain-containing protein [Burkholderiaceae bacterium]